MVREEKGRGKMDRGRGGRKGKNKMAEECKGREKNEA